MSFELDYLNLCSQVMNQGVTRQSRAGDTIGLFGTMLKIHDLREDRFPLLTTRKMFPRPIFGELTAFIRGNTKVQQFKDLGCNYWDHNAKQWGRPDDVGKIYGYQWRNFGGVDQLQGLVQGLITSPFSRRHVVSCWNPPELNEMCLPPCHILFQCYVNSDFLDMAVNMRSVDVCLGLPTDIVLYATLLIALARHTTYRPGSLTFMLGDTHMYKNHVQSFKEQEVNHPLDLPKYEYTGHNLFLFQPERMAIHNYAPHPKVEYVLN